MVGKRFPFNAKKINSEIIFDIAVSADIKMAYSRYEQYLCGEASLRLFWGKAGLRVIQYVLLYLHYMNLVHCGGHPGHVGGEGDGVDD